MNYYSIVECIQTAAVEHLSSLEKRACARTKFLIPLGQLPFSSLAASTPPNVYLHIFVRAYPIGEENRAGPRSTLSELLCVCVCARVSACQSVSLWRGPEEGFRVRVWETFDLRLALCQVLKQGFTQASDTVRCPLKGAFTDARRPYAPCSPCVPCHPSVLWKLWFAGGVQVGSGTPASLLALAV